MRLLALVVALALAAAAGTAGAAPPREEPVPILEYHVIGSPPATAPYADLYVDVSDFRAQLAWLARHRFHAVRLDQVLAHWRRGTPLPPHPVVLTFDDGYPEDWQTVLPLLAARGWPGNLNLQVGNLVPLHVRQLLAAGWEIDAHTFTHPDLTTISDAQLRREVAGSRQWIRHVFHVPCDAFTYPAGRQDARVRAAVRAAGFAVAETEIRGWASPQQDPYLLDRIEVGRGTTLAGFALELAHP